MQTFASMTRAMLDGSAADQVGEWGRRRVPMTSSNFQLGSLSFFSGPPSAVPTRLVRLSPFDDVSPLQPRPHRLRNARIFNADAPEPSGMLIVVAAGRRPLSFARRREFISS